MEHQHKFLETDEVHSILSKVFPESCFEVVRYSVCRSCAFVRKLVISTLSPENAQRKYAREEKRSA